MTDSWEDGHLLPIRVCVAWHVAVVERLVNTLCADMCRLALRKYTRAMQSRGGIPDGDELKG